MRNAKVDARLIGWMVFLGRVYGTATKYRPLRKLPNVMSPRYPRLSRNARAMFERGHCGTCKGRGRLHAQLT